MIDRQFWLEVRHALLMLVGAIERMLNITPTTKEIRDRAKDQTR